MQVTAGKRQSQYKTTAGNLLRGMGWTLGLTGAALIAGSVAGHLAHLIPSFDDMLAVVKTGVALDFAGIFLYSLGKISQEQNGSPLRRADNGNRYVDRPAPKRG